jgi:hypothetical protein
MNPGAAMTSPNPLKVAVLVGLLIALFASSGAAAIFDEAVLGDLSGIPASPTPWALSAGSNRLSGVAGTDSAGMTDFDLVALEIPAGHQLDSITIISYSNPDVFAMSFFGLQPGSPWLDGLGFDINGAWLMGWAHVQTHMAGFDLLTMIQDHANEPAFDIPVPAGVYTMLIEDVDTIISYSLQFNVSAVPEPTTAALLSTAIAMVVRRRR